MSSVRTGMFVTVDFRSESYGFGPSGSEGTQTISDGRFGSGTWSKSRSHLVSKVHSDRRWVRHPTRRRDELRARYQLLRGRSIHANLPGELLPLPWGKFGRGGANGPSPPHPPPDARCSRRL